MLREIAIRTTVVSPLMTKRDKLEVEELKDKLLTIEQVDLITVKDKKTGEYVEVAVMVFKEYPDKFIFGGVCFVQIVKAWLEECKIIEKINESLKEEVVQIRVEKERTKEGNNINRVYII